MLGRRGGQSSHSFGLVLPAVGWKPGLLLVPVYAPLVTKTTLKQRDEFREQLSKIFDHSSSRRRLVVGGDFNGEVGPAKDSLWKHVMGPYGHAKRTRGAGGVELLQFCEEEQLVVTGSFTRQTHKATWYHNRWGTAHALDHFLVPGGGSSVDGISLDGPFRGRSASCGRLGRPLVFSSAPWLEHTDHDPVELNLRVGKDWFGEALRKVATSSRPDVVRFLGCSQEAAQLRKLYAEAVSEELEPSQVRA